MFTDRNHFGNSVTIIDDAGANSAAIAADSEFRHLALQMAPAVAIKWHYQGRFIQLQKYFGKDLKSPATEMKSLQPIEED